MNQTETIKRTLEYWSIPEPNTGCWLWTGSLNPRTGYGSLSINKRHVYSHRASYEAYKGPIPEGFQIDHLCRVRSCMNPDHLEAVTPSMNTRRSPIHQFQVQMAKTHCVRGHPYDDANTWRSPSHPTRRRCRACRNLNQNAWRAKRRLALAGGS